MFHYREGDARGMGTFIYTLTGGQFEGSFKIPGEPETKSVLTRQGGDKPSGAALPASPSQATPIPAAQPSQTIKPIAVAETTPMRAACVTERFTVPRMRDNPSVTVSQTTTAGAACNLTFRTDSPGNAAVAAGPAHGTVTRLEPLKLKYQPINDYKGTDRYIVKLCDEAGCATVTYNVTVQ